MNILRTARLTALVLLGFPFYSEELLSQSADKSSKAGDVRPGGQNQVGGGLLLTGIATIGERKFVYLSDPVTAQAIELVTGMPGVNGVQLLKVQDDGFAATWKVLIKCQGSECWLNFAAPSQLSTAGSLAILSSATAPAAPPANFKRPPAQNPGTMSNETPSSAVSKRPLNSYPLPGGL